LAPSWRRRATNAIASGKLGCIPGGFASNGYGDLSPGKYGLASCLLIVGFAGIPIGLCLTLIHLFLIPVSTCRFPWESRDDRFGVIDESAIRQRFEALAPVLDERARRRFAAAEVRRPGVAG
jgi:hypothetical protein